MPDDQARDAALRLLVRRLSMHSHMTAADRSAVLALPGALRALKARSDFLHAREGVEHSCLVASGIIGRYAPLEDGSRQVISLHLPGDLVDIYSLMLPNAPTPLMSLSAAEVIRIPHAALRETIAANPALATILWRDTVVDGSTTAQATVNVGRRNARDRVAHLVCELAIRFDRIGMLKGMSFAFPLTQEQIGDLLALTSVHVNRTLKSLREDGVVRIAGGRVDILDWVKLQSAANFDGAYLCAISADWSFPLGKRA